MRSCCSMPIRRTNGRNRGANKVSFLLRCYYCEILLLLTYIFVYLDS